MMKSKVYQLTINHQPLTLTLIPSNQRREGYCLKCKLEKEI
ncbi:MAG: hypothetical protein NY202_03545 [Mollicutes bacterium UO1]